MFQRVTRPFSKSNICRPVVKALSSAAMLASLGASVLTNQTFACEHCVQSCPSCSCSHGYAPRSKPLSVLQLGHLVDGLDHAADKLERTLVPRHHHGFGCDTIGCDHCDAAVGQQIGQTSYDSTIWNSYVPEMSAVPSQGSNSVLVPNARPKTNQPIGTGVQEEHIVPALPVPQPFNPSAVPSLQVPTSVPQEDYRHDPFGDDANGTSKPRNRYTENSRSKSIQVPQSRGSETAAKAAPAPYTREHGLAHLAAQQQKPAARATAQSNVPVKSKAEAQTNVELATANKPSQGIRVQIGSKFVAPRPITSTPIQAVYEATVNSDDLVQPATALRLSN